MKTSIKIYPNKGKKSTKNSKTPFYLRVIHYGKKSEARLNVSDVTEEQLKNWSQETQRFSLKLSRQIESIRLINNKFQAIENKFDELLNSEIQITSPSQVKDILLERGKFSKEKSSVTFYKLMNNHVEKVIMRDSEISAGTKKNKNKALKHLFHFLQESKYLDIKAEEFDELKADDFLRYLTDEIDGRARMKKVSAKAIIKEIKTLINALIKQKKILKNPFNGQVIKVKHQIKPTLTEKEFLAIKNLNCSEKLTVYKDLFLVMCYTGLSYTDLQDLTVQSIEQKEITIQRNKSSVITRQHLPKQVLDIFTIYSNYSECEITKMALPKRSLDKMNLNLKLIGALSNLPHDLTTKFARRFFRSSLNKAGIYEPHLVKSLMGHSVQKDMDKHYLYISDEMLIEAKQKLESYFKRINNGE